MCGAGCASLTFLYEILSLQQFLNKKILVIDSFLNKENDRTWCFWEKSANRYKKLENHNWANLNFYSHKFSKTLDIHPYNYKKIKGIDFYNFTLAHIKKFTNVTFLEDEIIAIENKNGLGYVKTKNDEFYADYVFNSTLITTPKQKLETLNSLLQHFKGYEIEIDENCFNANEATFMDFTISQNLGTAFVYVLPTATNKALVEYTFFTKQILQQDQYDDFLKNYITNHLKINNYTVTHTEFGIIPMTDYKFPLYNGKIINMGTVGGCVKPSTGFAFKNIQKQVNKIVHLLANNKKPYLKRSFNDRKFHFYDSILLEVLAKNKMKGDEVFASIFKRNKPQLVLKFLDNETNIFEDLKIMSSVPMKIFLPIAVKKILRLN